MTSIGFLGVPDHTPDAQSLFDDDISDLGYVMNVSRLWAYQPGTFNGLFDLIRETTSAHRLDVRQRGILVAACASTLGDSYCSLAWGGKLAALADARTASAVIRGDDDGLTASEAVMADWARKVARDPNGTSGSAVQALRDVGYGDAEIFAITVFRGAADRVLDRQRCAGCASGRRIALQRARSRSRRSHLRPSDRRPDIGR